MDLNLKQFAERMEGGPGGHAVLEIQQMGDDAGLEDTTDIIVDSSPEERDIRIVDGDDVLKITLDQDYEIQNIYKNDIALTE